MPEHTLRSNGIKLPWTTYPTAVPESQRSHYLFSQLSRVPAVLTSHSTAIAGVLGTVTTATWLYSNKQKRSQDNIQYAAASILRIIQADPFYGRDVTDENGCPRIRELMAEEVRRAVEAHHLSRKEGQAVMRKLERPLRNWSLAKDHTSFIERLRARRKNRQRLIDMRANESIQKWEAFKARHDSPSSSSDSASDHHPDNSMKVLKKSKFSPNTKRSRPPIPPDWQWYCQFCEFNIDAKDWEEHRTSEDHRTAAEDFKEANFLFGEEGREGEKPAFNEKPLLDTVNIEIEYVECGLCEEMVEGLLWEDHVQDEHLGTYGTLYEAFNHMVPIERMNAPDCGQGELREVYGTFHDAFGNLVLPERTNTPAPPRLTSATPPPPSSEQLEEMRETLETPVVLEFTREIDGVEVTTPHVGTIGFSHNANGAETMTLTTVSTGDPVVSPTSPADGLPWNVRPMSPWGGREGEGHTPPGDGLPWHTASEGTPSDEYEPFSPSQIQLPGQKRKLSDIEEVSESDSVPSEGNVGL